MPPARAAGIVRICLTENQFAHDCEIYQSYATLYCGIYLRMKDEVEIILPYPHVTNAGGGGWRGAQNIRDSPRRQTSEGKQRNALEKLPGTYFRITLLEINKH